MPALSSVTFTSTHADSYEPVCLGNGIWNLICPDNPETFGADITSLIDLHLDITIPSGFYGIITEASTGIVGTSNCGVIPQVLLPGTTSILFNVANPSASNETPTANNVIAKLVLIKGQEFKYTQAGTWA
jgi:hypothetical protein